MADCFSTIKDRYIAECGVLADPNTSTSARIRAQANHVREAEKKKRISRSGAQIPGGRRLAAVTVGLDLKCVCSEHCCFIVHSPLLLLHHVPRLATSTHNELCSLPWSSEIPRKSQLPLMQSKGHRCGAASRWSCTSCRQIRIM